VIRAVSRVVIVTLAVVLAGSACAILLGEAGARLAGVGAARLVAPDAFFAPGLGRERILEAWLTDPRGTGAARYGRVYFAFDARPVQLVAVNRDGHARRGLWSALPPGRHPFTAFVPETAPALGARDSGTVWVPRAEQEVVWVAASAVLAGADGSAGAAETAARRRAVSALAEGRIVVYLVLARDEAYARTRRRLRQDPGLPPGPALPIDDTDETTRGRDLRRLRNRWPFIAGVAVPPGPLADAARRLHLPLVPAGPDEAAGPAGP
jgi:hypothetical protein